MKTNKIVAHTLLAFALFFGGGLSRSLAADYTVFFGFDGTINNGATAAIGTNYNLNNPVVTAVWYEFIFATEITPVSVHVNFSGAGVDDYVFNYSGTSNSYHLLEATDVANLTEKLSLVPGMLEAILNSVAGTFGPVTGSVQVSLIAHTQPYGASVPEPAAFAALAGLAALALVAHRRRRHTHS